MNKTRATYDHHKMLMFLLENETEWYSHGYRGQESWILAVWEYEVKSKYAIFEAQTKIECLDKALTWKKDKGE